MITCIVFVFSGEIRTKISFDREEQKVYEIPVVAVDGGGKLGFTSVRAWVSDVNDNAPTFLLPEYKACIHSNLTVNSGFLKVGHHLQYFHPTV